MSAAGGNIPFDRSCGLFFVCALCAIISETMQRYNFFEYEDNRGLEI